MWPERSTEIPLSFSNHTQKKNNRNNDDINSFIVGFSFQFAFQIIVQMQLYNETYSFSFFILRLSLRRWLQSGKNLCWIIQCSNEVSGSITTTDNINFQRIINSSEKKKTNKPISREARSGICLSINFWFGNERHRFSVKICNFSKLKTNEFPILFFFSFSIWWVTKCNILIVNALQLCL